MSFYKNPAIGWFLKKRLKKIFAMLILTLIFYYLYFNTFTHLVTSGCTRPDCTALPCTGYKCRASACTGTNCKGAYCIGERCEGGDCKGIGCRAGDCYGLDCEPGKCVDPTCQGERKLKKVCVPFCRNGRAYTIPRNPTVYPFIKYLPKNSSLNPDYCNPDKRTLIFTSDRYINNFKVDEINLFTSGPTKYENVKNKDSLQAGKSYRATEDINFISSTPDVYKNGNCEWTTQFKGFEITSEFTPFFNDKTQESKWLFKNFLGIPVDDAGNEQPCTSAKVEDHDMKAFQTETVISQINKINKTFTSLYLRNYNIDQIEGEKITSRCNLCQKIGTNYLNVKEHPTYTDSNIKPCLIRCYELDQIKNYGEVIRHNVKNYKSFIKNSPEYNTYINNNVNTLKTFNDHHIWKYTNTIGNSQIYTCHLCNEQVQINYKSLPRRSEYDLTLLSCLHTNDFNHCMYDMLDNNNTIYQKCIKCQKKSYPYQQKNI